MIVTKVIEYRIDIQDINSIFTADHDKLILKILNNIFLNKCYKSIYITAINRIIRRSKILCKNKVLDGTMYVDVMFEVTGIIYESGEIIHGCKVIQISNNDTIHADSKIAAVQIKTSVNIFKVGDIISVIVHAVGYKLFSKKIAVLATPLVPTEKPLTIYKVNKDEYIIPKIENKLKPYTKNKTVYNFFRDLLYPYKKYKDYSKIYTCKKNTLDNLDKIQNEDLIIRPDLYLDDDGYYVLDEMPDNIPVVEIQYSDLCKYLIHSYEKSSQILIDFIENYNTPDRIKEVSHLWSMYQQLKK